MKRIAPTGSSATTEVLIDRTRVWLTARFAASAKVRFVGGRDVLGVLPDLVEHHDRVVQRVAEDREEADDGVRRHLEPDQGVDPRRDQQVVQQGDDRRDGHRPGPEVQRDDQGHQDQEDDQARDRLAR